jgi:membrane protein DedA with SNARE-associated domain
MLASVSSSITSQIGSHGVYAVFVAMAIGAVFPAGTELVMLYGGAVAAGTFSTHVSLFGATIGSGAGAYVVIALAGTLGYLAGALVGWGIGRYGGRPLLERRGRWLHVTPDRLDRAERWFDRWDVWAVLVGPVTPVIRSFVAIPAGLFEMPLAPYAALVAVGSAIWAFAFGAVGWALGRSYKRFDHSFHYAEYAIVAGVLMLAAYLVFRRIHSSRLARRADDPAR